MPDLDRAAVAAALRANHDAQVEAMVLGDVPELDTLLTDDFALTHPTGYRQRKADWLDDIAEDRIRYDGIDVVEVAVDAARITPVLTARTITEATLWGAAGTWHLQLRITYREQDGAWLAQGAVASTW